MSIYQTRECVGKLPEGHLGSSLVVQPLSEEQWATLDRINETLTKEYSVRRQMLLTRCDVTVQSFKWSERIKVGRGTCRSPMSIGNFYYRARRMSLSVLINLKDPPSSPLLLSILPEY